MRSSSLVGSIVLAAATSVSACKPSAPAVAPESAEVEAPSAARMDVHSYAEPNRVVVEHVGLALQVDFDARRLSGTATLRIERRDPEAPLVLDTRQLQIERVEVARSSGDAFAIAELGDAVTWTEAAHELGTPDAILGAALRVTLPPDVDLVRIRYRTTEGASGLQWLEPAQTAGRKHPFLYSQSQAIHARSWMPIQDTPSVRLTYDAAIETPRGLVAVMSAATMSAGDAGPGQRFEMRQPIPAYLVALAVGDLKFASLGKRTGVFAEPAMLDAAAYEFADTERMLEAVEKLYGPYRWDRYDILVLPPAFPFGGMENPRMTFATPTIIAGDRSLVALIAHELAHSWSGNLVTNATWADLWLNEGFTVYIERRITEELYGRGRADMEAVLGRQDLEEAFAEMPDEDERLRPELAGRDPDEGLSDVAYEKGALFLRMLEETYGRAAFDPFLQAWFAEHAFTSVTTEQFRRFLADHLLAEHQPLPGKQPPDVAAWIEGPGVGPGAPQVSAAAFGEVDQAVAGFAGGASPGDLRTKAWTPHQWLHFLRGLPKDVGPDRLAKLDAAFGFSRSRNSEILAQWLEIGVARGYRAVDRPLEAFLSEVGRRKFLMPLYGALVDAGRIEDARRIYASARAGYHPISQSSLDELLGRPS